MIRRLVRDLDIPVRIEICPTVRDADGLALSSRNVLLSHAERERATALHRALARVREAVLAGADDARAATVAGLAELSSAGIEPEYLELVSADTLAPREQDQRRGAGGGGRQSRDHATDRQRTDSPR